MKGSARETRMPPGSRVSKRILCLAVLLTLLALAAGALQTAFADTDPEGVLTYTMVDTDTAVITKCITTATDTQLASAFYAITGAGIAITGIGESAFYGCIGLTSIDIPDGVTSIGDYVFSYCTSLTSVTIPDTVTSIGENAFRDCTSLASIELPDTVVSIGDGAFYQCTALGSVTIPTDMTSIGDYVFYYCTSLTSVTIPGTVTSIGEYAFFRCSGLTDIGILDGVKSIGNYAFCQCLGLKSVAIPAVESIGEYAFSGCTKLEKIDIPVTVASISGYTFRDCTSLAEIAFSEGSPLTSIGTFAFSGCSKLASIDIPDGVKSIGDGAFYSCTSLASVTIPDGVTSISHAAFSGCSKLTSVTILGAVTSINAQAFQDCRSLTGITIPAGVTVINERTFYGCSSLTGIAIPAGVTSIGNYAFYGSGLTSVTIPSAVKTIADYVFQNCAGLASVNIHDGVTGVGKYAFYGCTSLTGINISDVKSIGEYAFYGSGLTSVTVTAEMSVGEYAFYGCSKLTGVTIADGVASISRYAFSHCTGLTSVDIPGSVTSIGYEAFSDCTKLASATIHDGVTGIGQRMFYNCTSLTSIDIPDSLTGIGNYAFYGCTSLKNINIPGSVESIGGYAFQNCTGLTSITIQAGVKSVGERAFRGCTGLTGIVIPAGVTSIGNGAFSVSGIADISIPATVTTMGSSGSSGGSAFSDMGESRIVFIHGRANIPDNTFYYAGASSGSSFSNPMDVYVPMSVMSVSPAAFKTPNGNLTVWGVAESYIGYWASDNGINFEPIKAEITETHYKDAYELVPYQYIIETNRPGNADLSFVVDEETPLPLGLSLLPDGRFHGAPLETGVFTFRVKVYFTLFGEGEDYLMDYQEIQLTVTEPDDAALASWNDYYGYEVDHFVGEPADPNIAGNYVLTGDYAVGGLADQVFEAADNPEDELAGLSPSNHIYFVDFWLDGLVLRGGISTDPDFVSEPDLDDYIADPGSTVVTVYAKTFQSLDNGEHTIAAEFMIPNPGGLPTQRVSAQKFTLALTGEKSPGGGDPPDGDGSGDPGGNPPGGDGSGDPSGNPPDVGNSGNSGNSGSPTTSGSNASGGDTPPAQAAEAAPTTGETLISTPEGSPPVRNADGSLTLSAGGTATLRGGVTVEAPAGTSVDASGAVRFPEGLGGTVKTPGGVVIELPSGALVEGGGTMHVPAGSAGATVSYADGSTAFVPAGYMIELLDPDTPLASALNIAWDNPFGDVDPGAWHYADVVYVCEKGLMNGASATGFDPDAPMTRGMLVTVLHRAAGSPAPPEGGGAAFPDLPVGAYYAEAAAWAAAGGILTGAGDGRAAPLADISRQDLATLLMRYADATGMALPALRPAETFADAAQTAGYAQNAVRALAAAGVLNARPGNIFDPQGRATRAEAAAVLHRFLETAEQAAARE